MIHAARTLLTNAVTVAAVNAQIDALNTLYGTTVPHIALVADGITKSPEHLKAQYPAILHYVGLDPETGETARFGKRDMPEIPIVLAYHDDDADLDDGREAIDITLEALLPVLEGLQGQELGSTGRQIVMVENIRLAVGKYDRDAAAIRVGGTLSATLFGRTQGV